MTSSYLTPPGSCLSCVHDRMTDWSVIYWTGVRIEGMPAARRPAASRGIPFTVEGGGRRSGSRDGHACYEIGAETAEALCDLAAYVDIVGLAQAVTSINEFSASEWRAMSRIAVIRKPVILFAPVSCLRTTRALVSRLPLCRATVPFGQWNVCNAVDVLCRA